MYAIEQISAIVDAQSIIVNHSVIEHLLIDSRKISFPSNSLFFALVGERRDGHSYLDDVYQQGVRNFIVSEKVETSKYEDCNFLVVDNTLRAFQKLVAHHRNQFNIPIIGITGSNGKTIVKEWLNELLHLQYSICRSPKSYNSQIGVPLSVWQLNENHNLGIFEAGISTNHEMQQLQNIIKPTIGILTNIGDAHNEGFSNIQEKIHEKLKLFSTCNQIISCADDELVERIIKNSFSKELFSWGKKADCNVQILNTTKHQHKTDIVARFQNNTLQITIPFVDDASIHNACTCWATALYLGIEQSIIQQKMLQLHAVEMRLQLVKAMNNCILINDSYSNDLSSLHIALDYLTTNANDYKKTLIISDFAGDEKEHASTYSNAIKSILEHKIDKVIFIGTSFKKHIEPITEKRIEYHFYTHTFDFLSSVSTNNFRDEYILLKGARVFNFELISKWLQQKTHQTVMEINLTALIHNLKEYQKFLLPTTKTMAMVKAFSYGSGSVEIAKVLQFHKVDYLGLAYADEGIDLRKAGINLPIMILNVDEENFDALIEYNLEPEIFSFNIYNSFNEYLLKQGISNFPVHIKLNTGMNRLGFDTDEVGQLADALSSSKTMLVKSVLSHLASSEDKNDDEFTIEQLNKFNTACSIFEKKLRHNFFKHIANSAAIFRHPKAQYDLVRLGIGLYGIDSAKDNQINLQTVATLKSTIAQIRNVHANDTIGYNRKGKVQKNSKIATVRIGYADGLSRSLSNGKGFMFLHNKLAPIIGNVCMDMTMIDVSDIPEAQENDIVEIFGKHISVNEVAKWSNTIPYETLCSVNQRVRRIYIEE